MKQKKTKNHQLGSAPSMSLFVAWFCHVLSSNIWSTQIAALGHHQLVDLICAKSAQKSMANEFFPAMANMMAGNIGGKTVENQHKKTQNQLGNA